MTRMQVVFSDRASASMTVDIQYSILEKKEIGGVLLGHIENNIFYVIENVCPGFNIISSPVTFQYDKEFVDYLANHYSQMYKPKLHVIGLWHTHIDGEGIFSPSDRELNDCFVEAFGNCIVSSLIVINDPNVRIVNYCIDEHHEEFIDCIFGDEYVPEYFKTYEVDSWFF